MVKPLIPVVPIAYKITNSHHSLPSTRNTQHATQIKSQQRSKNLKMTSISSSSFTCSSPLFSDSRFVNDGSHSPPSSVRCRPLRVSASCASTVERPRTRIGSNSSLYEVLGIHTGATCQEIKSAYRKLARVVHPDVAINGQTSAAEFMKVHEAYSTLTDAQKRADYDRMMLIRQTRPVMASSYSYATTMSGSAAGRRWETDQCW